MGSHLKTVQMNGLSSGLGCRSNALPSVLTHALSHPGYVPSDFLSQTIPSALWSLPNMTSLYLEGNGFTGCIDAGNFSAVMALASVSLANNRLTGTIPTAIQQYGRFVLLDLSYNKLSGQISNSFVISSSPQSNINLAVNRLSGESSSRLCPQCTLCDI